MLTLQFKWELNHQWNMISKSVMTHPYMNIKVYVKYNKFVCNFICIRFEENLYYIF